MADTTWVNAFDAGACVVSVYRFSGSVNALQWTGSMAKGDSHSFDDDLGDNDTVAVDASGVVSLTSDKSSAAGVGFYVDVQPRSGNTGTRVANATSSANATRTAAGGASVPTEWPPTFDTEVSLAAADPPAHMTPNPTDDFGAVAHAGVLVAWAGS